MLVKNKFFYAFDKGVETPDDLYLSDFEPEETLFSSKEELLASL